MKPLNKSGIETRLKMDQNLKYKLKVLTGIHQDAELGIDKNEKYIIGSSNVCDIIIIDSGVEEEHVCLYSTNSEFILVKKSNSIFIDGNILIGQEKKIEPYQIITIGNVHFAIGPADKGWPNLALPEINNTQLSTFCLDLVPINIENKSTWFRSIISNIYDYYEKKINTLLKVDRKVIAGIGIFCLVFMTFWIDFVQSGMNISKIESNSSRIVDKNINNSKSVLIYANSMLNKIKDRGLVSTGVKEPSLNVDSDNSYKPEPIQKVRDYLYGKWKSSLSEKIKNNKEIDYHGKNNLNQTNLDITFKKESNGIFALEGFTLTNLERQGLVTNLGDLIRIKVIAAEDIAEVCQKLMRKKEIKNPSVKIDIEQKTATLEGKTNNLNLIPKLEEIIAKTIPEITLSNEIRFLPDELNIVGASTGNADYIKLNDGSKIFIGGKLKNGCIIENIQAINVYLNCNGFKVNYKLGEKI